MTNHNKGVLLVDDEPADLSVARQALENGGFTVFTASAFESALQVFHDRQSEIALAIMDVSLPGRNGVELAKQLLAVRPDLRLLFVSGHVGASVIRFYGIDATDEHFLQKPFEPAALVRRAEQALRVGKPLRAVFRAGESVGEF